MNDNYTYTKQQDQEEEEWIRSLDDVIDRDTPERVRYLLQRLQNRAYSAGIRLPFTANTPYINTIHHKDQLPYPGTHSLERRTMGSTSMTRA